MSLSKAAQEFIAQNALDVAKKWRLPIYARRGGVVFPCFFVMWSLFCE